MFRNLITCAALLIAIGLPRHRSLAQPSATQPSSVRKPVPDSSGLNAARRSLDQLHESALKSTSIGARTALIDRLMDQALTLENDSAGRFVRFQKARELSISAGDAGRAFRAAKETIAHFQIDAFQLNVDTLKSLAQTVRTAEGYTAATVAGLELVDAAIDYQRPDAAEQVLALLEPLVEKAAAAELRREYQQRADALQRTRDTNREIARLGQTLKTAPRDFYTARRLAELYAANHNWTAAIDLLVSATDPDLRATALLDQQAAAGRATPLSAADAWWNLRSRNEGPLGPAMADRAAFWYRRALPSADTSAGRIIQAKLDLLAPANPLAPAWTRATSAPDGQREFPGIDGAALRVVFIVDASGSMMDVLHLVRREIKSAVNALDERAEFNVIVFSDVDSPKFSRSRLVPATPESKQLAGEFLDHVQAAGSTEPLPALQAAFDQQATTICIYTDGFENVVSADKIVESINDMNRSKRAVIHCIFTNRSSTASGVQPLRAITSVSGGTLRVLQPTDAE